MSSVGIESNQDNVKRVVEALKGKEIHTVISEGLGLLGNISFGGAAAPAGGSSGPAKAAAVEEKKEAKKVEEEEEEDMDMDAGGLFGGDF